MSREGFPVKYLQNYFKNKIKSFWFFFLKANMYKIRERYAHVLIN